MKKLFIILLAAIGFCAASLPAEARDYYDRYGRSSYYSSGHHHHHHYNRGYDYYRPRVVYRAPVRYYYDDCAPRYRSYSRPRVSFSFGF